MSDFDLIRASDIAEYVYCHRAWWLKRVEGIASQNLRELDHGAQYHEDHDRQVRSAGRLHTAALFFVIIGTVLFILIRLFN